MKLIRKEPNPSGAYPPMQSGSFSSVPDGMAIWPEELSTETFYEYNGFVKLEVGDVEGIPVVTGYEANVEAWTAWKASLPPPEPEPTAEEQIETLKTELNATDYQIIKCSEYQLAGLDMPYDIAELHAKRQALRDQINALEAEE